MLALATTKENPEHGPNESVSEQTELMGDCMARKDQLDEPKMTAPSPANETDDNGTRNDGSDSSQVGPKESSSMKKLPGKVIAGGSSLTSSGRKTHCAILGLCIINLIIDLFILVIASKSQKSSCPACPEDWITWRRKCYYFSDAEGTWNSSQHNCSWHGASLFVPGPEQEMAFIRRIVGYTESWIGLWREEGAPWKQPDGSVFNSSFQIRADGPCAYLDKETAGSTWCDTERNWICTKSLPIV